MKFFSASEKQTFNFAKNFSKKLTGGETLGLIGNLGAGKTVFTKGLAAGLGVKKNITSPTFVLIKTYPVKSPRQARRILPSAKLFDGVNPVTKHKQIKLLIHVDAYRIKSAQDLNAVGINEYINRPDAVTVIEWADRIKKILPRKTRLITITYKNRSRVIKF